ncbi:unnamed protein product [Rhizophagus irregularis]|nr:unnamed protein product [Rhizophagus irregularis]
MQEKSLREFLEWVPFDRFKNVKQIGVDGFANVYSATWIDGMTKDPEIVSTIPSIVGIDVTGGNLLFSNSAWAVDYTIL